MQRVEKQTGDVLSDISILLRSVESVYVMLVNLSNNLEILGRKVEDVEFEGAMYHLDSAINEVEETAYLLRQLEEKIEYRMERG